MCKDDTERVGCLWPKLTNSDEMNSSRIAGRGLPRLPVIGLEGKLDV
jgi:hypothetical protein